MTHDRENIRFNVLRNALYHTARRRALERVNRVFNFLVVILGATAFGDLADRFSLGPEFFGLIIVVIGALQLVFDFGRQARDHQSLQRDYYRLLSDIERSHADDAASCADWYSRMIGISADEPPILRALDAKAYNDALDATGTFPATERLRIPLHHRLAGAFVPFDGYNYRKLAELGADR